MKKVATRVWHLLRQTAAGALRDNVPRLSASLAYYTLFSLGPMLLVVVFVCGYFGGSQRVESGLFVQIQKVIGPAAALQLRKIMQYAALDGHHPLGASIGLVTLLLAATSVFTEIQDSLNSIWHLKLRPDAGWLQIVRTRLLSFALVITLGVLLLASLGLSLLLASLLARLRTYSPNVSVGLVYATDLVLSLLFTSGLYTILFKVLPDARIRWRDVAVGALFTAALFMLGRFSITYYLGHSNLNKAYGTAGTLVVLLVWVYYSALILYVGAEFTKYYTITYGDEIQADTYAQVVQTVQVASKHGKVRLIEQNRAHTERELQRAQDALDAAEPQK
ncbi:YihY/virulence factor BrkB family protein [Hymenobacter baengnokdamensis]|uniref:YihY/virulence factor BrkB family protein n=1 Tax=Hymenobacter baengnokdamensis TaxID=2615203 RepID=UPI001244C900|nr:YihY/virulence factor BrkB family protein [Hymenobacter baengnokdamensis]